MSGRENHRDPLWIFFDCFDTLLIEDHGDEDWPFMAPSHHLAVENGYFGEPDAFRRIYRRHYESNWGREKGREVSFRDRVTSILCEQQPGRKDKAGALAAEMERRFRAKFAKGLRPAPGVREMLDAWRGHARLAVVSNFHVVDYPRAMLDRFGLEGHFEFVVNSVEIGWKKPHRRIYAHALGRAGMSRAQVDRVLFIGDSLENDVDGPRAQGLRSLRFRAEKSEDAGIVITHWDRFRPGRFSTS